MVLGPQILSITHMWKGEALEMGRDDAVDKVGGGNSRSQEGRRCKLHCTPNTKPTHLHWEGGLCPCWIVLTKVDVCNSTQGRLQEPVVLLQHWGEETGCGPKVVQELRKGKRVFQEEDGIMGGEELRGGSRIDCRGGGGLSTPRALALAKFYVLRPLLTSLTLGAHARGLQYLSCLSVCLCVCVCVCVCMFSLFWHLAQSGVQTAVSATSARYGHEI